MADAETQHAHSEDGDHHDEDGGDGSHPPARKRQRIRLSCLECRRRKLSCSRELPCDRCIKSGTPDRCTYETRDGSTTGPLLGDRAPQLHFALGGAPPDHVRHSIAHHVRDLSSPRRDHDPLKDHDRIRRLEMEITQLKTALSKQVSASLDGSTVFSHSPATLKDKDSPPVNNISTQLPPWCNQGRGDGLEYKFIRGHNFKTRFAGPHSARSSFKELTGLTTFMKETAEEWLKPLNIQRKDRKQRQLDREKAFAAPDPELDSLLPSKDEVDSLVAVYLDQFEQLYRIVHLPSFRRDYNKFWDSTQERCAAFTALVLAMISVSICLDGSASSKFVGVKSSSYQAGEKWIKAVDAWFDRQSYKHRRLIHYQIMCMLYLAKRINTIKKKRIWTNSGNMIRDAIIAGLHQEPVELSTKITPFYREMRRRIWATMCEFDLQASYDQAVPTLLGQLYMDTRPPRNIDDDVFQEDTEELPPSKPSSEYTFASYQNVSRTSLQLRLELNQLLTGPVPTTDWDQVQRFTEMIVQEIDALPTWDLEPADGSRQPLLAHTLLHLQLKQYLVSLHQPFLKLRQQSSKYEVSEFIYYNAARDMVIMQDRLYQKGIRCLYFLREDGMNASVNLCNVSVHQPRGSTSLIASCANDALKLIEKCIAMKEDRILRCGNNDPWGYSTMCAAYGLLEAHLGIKTPEAAKAAAAERFISLHYKLLAYQIPPYPSQPVQMVANTPQMSQDPINRAKSITPFPLDANTTMQMGATPYNRDGAPMTMPWLLPSTEPGQTLVPNPDFSLEGLGMDLNDLWGDWTAGEMI